MIRNVYLLALPLILMACGSPEPAGNSQETDDASAFPAPVDRWKEAKLIADPDGIRANGGSLVRFGTSREEVDAMATRAFGGEPGLSSNDECGAGPMEFSQYGPLQLAFQDGRFVGWFLRDGVEAITSDAIPVGWPLKALRLEREVRDVRSTLGTEFEYTTSSYGTITGFADDDPAQTITAFAAGMNCFFR